MILNYSFKADFITVKYFCEKWQVTCCFFSLNIRALHSLYLSEGHLDLNMAGSHETFTRVSHDSRETFVRASHDCETFARVSHDIREIFVRSSHDSRETFVRVSHDVRANFNKFYFSQLCLEIVLFMSHICRIVQIAESSMRFVCERLRTVGDGLATGSRHMR